MTQPAVHIDANRVIPSLGWFGTDRTGRYTNSSLQNESVSRWLLDKPATTNIPLPLRDHVFSAWSNVGARMRRSTGRIGFSGDWSAFNGFSYYTYEDGSFWDSPSLKTLPSAPSSLKNRAETKALLKLNSSHNAQVGVMLAEYRQTADLVSQSMMRIARAVRAFRRASPGQFLRAVRHEGSRQWRKTPQHWLELQYGWKPLMQDVNDSISLLSNKYGPDGSNSRYVRVIGKAGDSSEDNRRIFNSAIVPGLSSWMNFKSLYQYRGRCEILYTLTSPFVAELNEAGILNPASIVWEKVPYSFVVDWFLPVGNWLQALTAALGYTFVSGCYTELTKGQERKVDEVVNPKVFGPDFVQDIYVPDRIEFDYWSMRRSVYTSSPVPGLYFKSPLSSGHVANAMSLLTQAFKRK